MDFGLSQLSLNLSQFSETLQMLQDYMVLKFGSDYNQFKNAWTSNKLGTGNILSCSADAVSVVEEDLDPGPGTNQLPSKSDGNGERQTARTRSMGHDKISRIETIAHVGDIDQVTVDTSFETELDVHDSRAKKRKKADENDRNSDFFMYDAHAGVDHDLGKGEGLIQFSSKKRGYPMICYKRFLYNLHGHSNDRKRWYCTKRHRGCKAKLITTTEDPQVLEPENSHNHQPVTKEQVDDLARDIDATDISEEVTSADFNGQLGSSPKKQQRHSTKIVVPARVNLINERETVLSKFINSPKHRKKCLFPSDRTYTMLQNALKTGSTNLKMEEFATPVRTKNFKLVEDSVIAKDTKKKILPYSQFLDTFRTCHDNSNHPGRKGTLENLLRQWHYVPHTLVYELIAKCPVCVNKQTTKR